MTCKLFSCGTSLPGSAANVTNVLNCFICLFMYLFICLQVRYAAVNAVHELATKLGDEYMSLLPETIPFLAELMEGNSNLFI